MENTAELSVIIKKLLAARRFAVLATQSGGQPYTNLIAFAETDNLRNLLFVTSRNTRKYSNTLASKKVAVLVDSTTNQASDINNAIAITAIGSIEEVSADNKDSLSEIFLSKHPQLKIFLCNPSNALMKVEVHSYIVATFDNVRHLIVREIK